MTTITPPSRKLPLQLGAVLRSPHAEQRGFAGFAAQSVPIELNRAPDGRETRMIEGSDAHARLVAAGHGEVSIQVVAERLEVGGTTVAELDDELMRVLEAVVTSANFGDERAVEGSASEDDLDDLDEQEFPM